MFNNTPKTPAGFRQLVSCGGATSLYLLEATGPYYLALAYHMVGIGIQVVALNLLVVKCFIWASTSLTAKMPDGCYATASSKSIRAGNPKKR